MSIPKQYDQNSRNFKSNNNIRSTSYTSSIKPSANIVAECLKFFNTNKIDNNNTNIEFLFGFKKIASRISSCKCSIFS